MNKPTTPMITNLWRLLIALGLVTIGVGQACTGGSNGTSAQGPTASSTPATDGATTDLTTQAPEPRYRNPQASNIGINMGSVTSGPIFADMTKGVSSNHGRWDAGQAEASLTTEGLPTVAAKSGITGAYPSGAYSVSWDGLGTFAVAGASLSAVKTVQLGGVAHNTAVLTHVQNASSWLTFSVTPPISNLHIVAPSTEVTQGSYFLKIYIDRLRPFTTLRFLDAQNINGSTLSNWSDRTWPDGGSRYTKGGLAYEDIMAIANLIVADVWVNVPVNATDDYVCRLARLFYFGESGDKSNAPCEPGAPAAIISAQNPKLNRTSKLYLEYSNEIWGGIPSNRQVVERMANGETPSPSAVARAALANTSLPWSKDIYLKTSQLDKVLEKRISDIFKTVFAKRPMQVKMVSAIQAVWPEGSTVGLDFIQKAYGPVANYFDALGIAPYMEVGDSATGSVDAIFADLAAHALNTSPSESGSISSHILHDANYAKNYGLPMISYEGGQGLKGNVNYLMKVAAQHDPRMYDMYQKFFAIWNQQVGRDHVFVHYTDISGEGPYGAWGLLTYSLQPGSQKWDAVMNLTQVPGDLNFDGVVNADDCKILRAHLGQAGQWWRQGDFNHDGVVDAKDLALMNAHIVGAACTP